MKLALIALTTCLSLGIALPAKAESCRAYTVNTHNKYGIIEVNNCPPLGGTFSNSDWKVELDIYKPGAYFYKGINLNNGSSIQVVDFDVAGTTSRPQYRFQNKNVIYVVSFQYSEPNTIRLEVYQENHRILNQLLYGKAYRTISNEPDND
jgi:hypothetical protein